MAGEFFLEIFQEEIPSRMQARASEQCVARFSQQLHKSGLAHGALKSFVTPLRLILVVEDLEAMQPEGIEEYKGPLLNAPEQAIAGFLRRHGLGSIDDCDRIETRKGDALLYRRVIPSQESRALLPEMIAELLMEFSWPNSMRFADQDFRWVRPLRQVLAVYDGVVLSGDLRLGNRMLSLKQSVVLERFRPPIPAPESFRAYRDLLAGFGIILDSAERQVLVRHRLEDIAESEGCIWIEDSNLLEEVAGLVERVHVVQGRIDDRFMHLPDAILRLALRTHQKYFVFNDKSSGHLSAHYALVTPNPNPGAHPVILAGNQRVLRARLQDAEFFLQQDQRHPLIEHARRLSSLRFVEGLGSVHDKAQRIGKLLTHPPANLLAYDAERLALLAKADLVTEVLGEFPELQGTMGAHYAEVEGIETVWVAAIAEHYAPKGPTDALPGTTLGCLLALMDKLDTLAGFAAKNALPKGSGDPFAIRRAMLGVIRITVANGWLGFLMPLLQQALMAFDSTGEEQAFARLNDFYRRRMLQYLRDQGIAHGVALAAMDGEIAQTPAVAEALESFIATEAGQSLLATYVRAQGILKATPPQDPPETLAVPRSRLDRVDCILWDQARVIQKRLLEETQLTAPERFFLLGEISPPLDRFFETVLINTDDTAIKETRWGILRTVVSCMQSVANFDRLISG